MKHLLDDLPEAERDTIVRIAFDHAIKGAIRNAYRTGFWIGVALTTSAGMVGLAIYRYTHN